MDTLKIGDRLNTVWNSYGIPPKFINTRFNNYFPRNNDQNKALKRCMGYAEQDIGNIANGKGLFLHGPVGTGKTHIVVGTAYAIAAANVERFGYKSNNSENISFEEAKISQEYRGMYIGFFNVTDLLTTLQESYSGNERSKEKALYMLHRAKVDDIVILDDIGAMKPTEWVDYQLYNLVDIRYRTHRPMILTSNYDIDQLEKQVGERVVSRIIEVTDGVWVPGPDYRKRKMA